MAEIKWIKITTDMFDNRKIKHLRKLPEGNNIVLIWVMLLTMAGRCNASGMIFLTENIPYTPKMLADELGFEESTVHIALKALEQFNMIVTDGNFFSISGWEEYQNVDRMEEIREYNRIAKQKSRAKRKLLEDVNDMSMTSQRCQDTDIDKEKDLEGEKRKKKKPSVYYPLDDKLNKAFADYVEMRKQIKKPLTERAIELAQKKLEELSKGDNDVSILILEQSVMNCWQGLFPLKEDKQSKKNDDFMEMWRNA